MQCLMFEVTPKIMEKRHENLTLFEFQQQFPDVQACSHHLALLKWPHRFICEKLGIPIFAKEN
ncbi:MAG TPA: hypothetical protein DDX92_13655 [Flavobacteriales bacterium]|jgi:hypothetical protein|nr:hypothetical protein [Flavobacteriales bacterium]